MRQSVLSLRERTGGGRLGGQRLRSRLRRMALAASDALKWIATGYEDGEGNLEENEAEVFSGIGFYSRPHGDDRAEVLLLNVEGEANHPVIIATRSQDGIKRLGTINADETVIFTSQAEVRILNDGTIHARSIDGTAAPVATLADIQALITTFNAHLHTGVTTGMASSGPPASPASSASGTQILRAE